MTTTEQEQPIEMGLHAAVVAVQNNVPSVLTMPGTNSQNRILAGLPFGPFEPGRHRTLENGLRSWVEEQTHLKLGYVEQLYTFGDLGRLRYGQKGDVNFISVGYLALVEASRTAAENVNLSWNSWYAHFPWEDWRSGQPEDLAQNLLPALSAWVQQEPNKSSGLGGLSRHAKFCLSFGCNLPKTGTPIIESWDEERVLERYELMYEAGFVEESITDGHAPASLKGTTFGTPMLHDHRRILATAIARLRAKLKYRPVVFELMPEVFTLTELQQTVETLSGRSLHKQNFRRLVDNADLVEPTGSTALQTGGRPAAYFRFRREIMQERPAPGLKFGTTT